LLETVNDKVMKLTDFGMARVVDDWEKSTRTGFVAGSRDMGPSQALATQPSSRAIVQAWARS